MHRGQHVVDSKALHMHVLTATLWTARMPLPMYLFIACVCNEMYINLCCHCSNYYCRNIFIPFYLVSELGKFKQTLASSRCIFFSAFFFFCVVVLSWVTNRVWMEINPTFPVFFSFTIQTIQRWFSSPNFSMETTTPLGVVL